MSWHRWLRLCLAAFAIVLGVLTHGVIKDYREARKRGTTVV